MNELKLSENLVRLRREKNVTQEALAAFCRCDKRVRSQNGKMGVHLDKDTTSIPR